MSPIQAQFSPLLKAVLRILIRTGAGTGMFLGLPDPDPLVRDTDLDLDPSIIKQK
jgi:hypothetical protein